MDVSPISGVPEEHTRSRRVRIFEPAKNAMQSGTNNIQHWEMEFDNRQRWENPLMGWCSSGDPHSNLKLEFNSCEEAIAHCEKNGWNYFVEARPDLPEMRAVLGAERPREKAAQGSAQELSSGEEERFRNRADR